MYKEDIIYWPIITFAKNEQVFKISFILAVGFYFSSKHIFNMILKISVVVFNHKNLNN